MKNIAVIKTLKCDLCNSNPPKYHVVFVGDEVAPYFRGMTTKRCAKCKNSPIVNINDDLHHIIESRKKPITNQPEIDAFAKSIATAMKDKKLLAPSRKKK